MAIKKNLSTTDLKLLALTLMAVDHIYYFFSFTGRIPAWFVWLGRSSLPLFIFCLAEGFYHTRSREKYLLRLLIACAAMEACRRLLMSELPRPDGFFIQTNIFGTMFLIAAFIYCLDRLRPEGGGPSRTFFYGSLILLLSPLMLFVEGGYPYIILGIVLYFTRSNRLAQAVVYVVWCSLLWATQDGIRWMTVFAVLPMLLYDGRKGKGYKYLFYFFYPIHIILLYALSVALYAR